MTTQPISLPIAVTLGLQKKMESLVQAFRQSFSRMSNIKKDLEHALSLDFSAIGACVSSCIAKLHDEIERQKQEYDQSISELSAVIGTATAVQAVDPVTGLPNRPSAEAYLRNTLAQPDHGPVFLAVVVLEHLSSINSSYGYDAGNQVLCRCAQDLHPQLKPGDRLFRWDGPALAIVLERQHYQETVDYIAAKVAKRFSQTIEVDSRHAQLFITTRTGVFPAEGAMEKLPIADIEAFVQGRAEVPNYAHPPIPNQTAAENAPTPQGAKRPPIVRVRRPD